MGGSAADTPTPSKAQPAVGGGLRASDAEREQVAARLRDEYVAGRLSHETFVHRMHAVLEARHRKDLPPLVADLPARQRPADPPTARSLVGRLRGVWSRRRGPAVADQPASPQGTVSPDGARPAAMSPGRGVTMGMQTSAVESRPLSVRFPRGGEGEFSIGRDASCDLSISDMTVSRRHATLERTPEGWILTDLASTNGTRVNGWRVRGKVQVKAGDLVTFGNAEAVLIREDELLCCLGGSDPPQTPPAYGGLPAPHTPWRGAARPPSRLGGEAPGPPSRLGGGQARALRPAWAGRLPAPRSAWAGDKALRCRARPTRLMS